VLRVVGDEVHLKSDGGECPPPVLDAVVSVRKIEYVNEQCFHIITQRTVTTIVNVILVANSFYIKKSLS